jgi:hypothetical protein
VGSRIRYKSLNTFIHQSVEIMLQLYIGNKNYSSWSMRAWVLLRQAGIPFEEKFVRFDGFDSQSEFKRTMAALSPTGTVPLLRDGGTLSFPERPQTAAADLAEVRPQRFAATAAQWQALHQDLSRRLPAGRLVWPLAARRLRRRLGFDRAVLLLCHGGPAAPETAAFLAGIGLRLTEWDGDAIPR